MLKSVNPDVLILMSIILVSSTGAAYAQAPMIPCEFYGNVMINDNPAPVGTLIVAKIDGVERGSITTTEIGKYGGEGTFDDRLIVDGTGEDEGRTVTFFVNGVQASSEAVLNAGESKRQDFSITTDSNGQSSIDGTSSSRSSSPGSNTYSKDATSTKASNDASTSPTGKTGLPKAASTITSDPAPEEHGEQPSARATMEKGFFGIAGFEGIFVVFTVFVIYYMRRVKK